MGSIAVANLGKAYKKYPNRWARLIEWLDPRGKPRHQLHWVLRGINFTVQPGEAVGIIGINGAGKSTLLKLITGTTQPSTGSIQTTGRVAALLELGMGFHPEFTGRQNVFMAGQLLGIDSETIARLMPEIEAFAEIGDYIDQPVRVYSSGMQMRLAFSVATAIRPDILIVDEALSVGDAYFQHKSFDRIRQFRKQGTTLLIVSHDRQTIVSICDRALLLCAGSIVQEGRPEVVMDYYNALLADNGDKRQEVKQMNLRDGVVQTISGDGKANIVDVRLLDERGKSVDTVNVGQKIRLKVALKYSSLVSSLNIGFIIRDKFGRDVFGTNSDNLRHELPIKEKKEGWLDVYFEFYMNVGPGHYSITVGLHGEGSHINQNYEWKDNALLFQVVNLDKFKFVGVSWSQVVISAEFRDGC